MKRYSRYSSLNNALCWLFDRTVPIVAAPRVQDQALTSCRLLRMHRPEAQTESKVKDGVYSPAIMRLVIHPNERG